MYARSARLSKCRICPCILPYPCNRQHLQLIGFSTNTGAGKIHATPKKKLSPSSMKWTQRQLKDPYVKKARDVGSPSRAIFKLEEIDSMVTKYMQQQISKKKKGSLLFMDSQSPKKMKLFHNPNSIVLDLGAAPGGWSKYVADTLGKDGLLIAVDLLPLDERTVTSIEKNPLAPDLHFIQGDFTTATVKTKIMDLIQSYHGGVGVEYVLSDMAANFTGDNMTDALRTMNLCEDALMLAAGPSCFDEDPIPTTLSGPEQSGILMRGGTFLCKYFACGQQHESDLKNAVKRHFELSTILKPKASRKESAELYLFATGFRGGKTMPIQD